MYTGISQGTVIKAQSVNIRVILFGSFWSISIRPMVCNKSQYHASIMQSSNTHLLPLPSSIGLESMDMDIHTIYSTTLNQTCINQGHLLHTPLCTSHSETEQGNKAVEMCLKTHSSVVQFQTPGV